jgi:hypothetical protein
MPKLCQLLHWLKWSGFKISFLLLKTQLFEEWLLAVLVSFIPDPYLSWGSLSGQSLLCTKKSLPLAQIPIYSYFK